MANSQFKLIIEDDEGRRSVVPVDVGEVTIGRAANSTIRLNERNVSRSHTRLWSEDGKILARDLDSFNGTWVNGERLAEPYRVKEGDLLRIGDFQVELRGEGLPKADEATDRTTVPAEATQPGVRVDLADDESETFSSETIPAGAAVADVHEVTAEVPRHDSEDAPPAREEKTAIIRMADYNEVMAGPETTAVSAGERARLVCVSAQFAGEEFEIDKTEVVIGRTHDNDISVDHRSVSRHHAKITLEKNRYSVADLTSANGTLVNGEEYARVELKGGDLIELGHVKFRFIPSGETYSFTEEEMELIGPAESTRRATVSISGQVEPVNSTGLPIDPKVAAGIGGGILLVIILMIAFSGGDEPTAPVEETPTVTLQRADSAAVVKLLNRAEDAFDKRQWSQAEALANAALELEPTSARALDLLEKAGSEDRMKSLFEKANKDIRDGNWSGAWNALSDVSRESVYYSEAEILREQVRGGLISERISETNEAIESKDWDRASGLVDEILGLQPERPEIQTLRAAIEEGRAKAETPPPAPIKPAASKLAPKSKPKPVVSKPTPKAKPKAKPKPAPKPKPVVVKSTPKPKPKPKPKAVAKPQPAPPPAPKPAVVSGEAKDYFRGGVEALNQGAFNKAIEQFSKCIQADKNYGTCYRAMGITYARMHNGPKAARYYRLYLKVSPNAKDADQVRQLLKQYDGQ